MHKMAHWSRTLVLSSAIKSNIVVHKVSSTRKSGSAPVWHCLPLNPWAQRHEKLPGVFTHEPFWQPVFAGGNTHSSMSKTHITLKFCCLTDGHPQKFFQRGRKITDTLYYKVGTFSARRTKKIDHFSARPRLKWKKFSRTSRRWGSQSSLMPMHTRWCLKHACTLVFLLSDCSCLQ